MYGALERTKNERKIFDWVSVSEIFEDDVQCLKKSIWEFGGIKWIQMVVSVL